MMICLTGCAGLGEGIAAANLAFNVYESQNPDIIVVELPAGIDYFIPDEDYKDRWTESEKKQLLLHNSAVERVRQP